MISRLRELFSPARKGGGWTPTPNEVLEFFAHHGDSRTRVLAFVVRKNEGWSNPNKRFSVRYVAAHCGVSKSTAADILNGFVRSGLLTVVGHGPRGERLFNVTHGVSRRSDSVQNTGLCPAQNRTQRPAQNRTSRKKPKENKPVRAAELKSSELEPTPIKPQASLDMSKVIWDWTEADWQREFGKAI